MEEVIEVSTQSAQENTMPQTSAPSLAEKNNLEVKEIVETNSKEVQDIIKIQLENNLDTNEVNNPINDDNKVNDNILENIEVVEEVIIMESEPNTECLLETKDQVREILIEEPSSLHEQSDSNKSPFYESSDSKIDYAVKSEDNDTLSDIEDIKTDSASGDSEDSALGSLPLDPDPPIYREEGQDRSDGSDSGLGSETTEDAKTSNLDLEIPSASVDGISNMNVSVLEPIIKDNEEVPIKNESIIDETLVTKPLKSSLKRKIESESVDEPQMKKKKGEIKFDNVRVYYFPRSQGFSCVPSQGGSTLGMDWKHSHSHDFTIAEHALEQRRLHRQLLQQLKNERHSLQGVSMSSSEDSDTEEEASDISESELDLDSYYFLQPVPTRQRRALLRAAGVRKIEGYEKDECRDIRTSREFCGCACKGICNPETCLCSLSGIKCQVDRLNFPCGCARDGCKNTTGRIEFNPIRVRTHFIHTLMRLGLEKKNEEAQAAAKQQWGDVLLAPTVASTSTVANVPFDRNLNQGKEEGLRDVSLNQNGEVESCVSTGSFPNVQCNINSTESAPNRNIQNEINYRYTCDNASFRNVNNTLHVGESTDLRNHVDPYTSNILQGKGPPYTTGSNIGYDTMAHNVQRFPCDLNYYQHNEQQHFKHLQSFSASSFEEFVHNHNSHMSMFNNYGHMYASDYVQKHQPSVQDHTLQYQNHYDMYRNNSQSADNKVENYYAPMPALPYQTNNKAENDENDENWFSHKTLLGIEHGEPGAAECPPAPPAPPASVDAPAASTDTPPVTAEPNADTADNFGELIKQTIIESVSV